MINHIKTIIEFAMSIFCIKLSNKFCPFILNIAIIPIGNVARIDPSKENPLFDNTEALYTIIPVKIELNKGSLNKFIYILFIFYFRISRVFFDAICSDSFLVLAVPVQYFSPFITTIDVKIFLCVGPVVEINSYSGLI